MIASDRRGLDSQVLLLNRFYMPMQVISARQAFTLLCRESAEVIDVDHGHFYNYSFENWQELSLLRAEENLVTNWIHSPRQIIEVPQVLRLIDYDQIPVSYTHLTLPTIYSV